MRFPKAITQLLTIYHACLALYWGVRVVGIAWQPLFFLHTFALWLTLPVFGTVLWVGIHKKKLPLLGLVGLMGGLWLIAPYVVRPAPAPPQGEPLTVISFNLWAYNPRFLQAVAWLAQQDAHVLVLQEIDYDGTDPRLAPLAERFPYEARIDGSVRIFSRLPFLSQRVIALETLQEEPDPRLILRVTIAWQGETVVIYGVHLSLPEADADTYANINLWARLVLGYDETRRNRQIERVVQQVQRETAPTLLIGDFNTSSTSPIIHTVSTKLMDSWRVAGAGIGTTYPAWQSLGVVLPVPALLRIDYVWHNSGWKTRTATLGDPHGSDHFPLLVTLEREQP